MRRFGSLVRDERGVAMVYAVFVTALVITIAIGVLDSMTSETQRTGQAERRQSAYEAAEAGIDEYIAKLTDDQLYYLHDVDPAEATRTDTPSGTTVSATGDCSNPTPRPSPVTWTLSTQWSYQNGKDRWCGLGNGYEYNLEITPPGNGQTGVTILSTGRRVGSTNTSEYAVVQAVAQRDGISNFQMLANVSITYGSNATTNGLIYSTANITHNGTANADVYAEGTLSGSVTFTNGAKGYDMSSSTTSYPSLDTVPMLKNHHPIDFSGFLTSFDNLARAASSGGISLDDSSKDAWWLVFNADGTVTIKSCTRAGGSPIEVTQPTCTTTGTQQVPANGAIHVQQSAIVSGVVNGRVTVASENNIVVGGNITYVQGGDDVLGLEAKNYTYVPHWAPNDLTWYSATLSQSGQWESENTDGWSSSCNGGSGSGCKGTLNFYGSTTAGQGGQMGGYSQRIYNYDSNLLYLPPPWFPTIQPSWEFTSFRQLAAG
jgi:Tfp pilus assembly protein PilX